MYTCTCTCNMYIVYMYTCTCIQCTCIVNNSMSRQNQLHINCLSYLLINAYSPTFCGFHGIQLYYKTSGKLLFISQIHKTNNYPSTSHTGHCLIRCVSTCVTVNSLIQHHWSHPLIIFNVLINLFLFVALSVCLSIYLSLSLRLSVRLCLYLSVYLCLRLSGYIRLYSVIIECF